MNSNVVAEAPTSFDKWFSTCMSLPDTDTYEATLMSGRNHYPISAHDQLSVSPPATTLSRQCQFDSHRRMLPCDPQVLDSILGALAPSEGAPGLSAMVEQVMKARLAAGFAIPEIGKGVLQDVEVAVSQGTLHANCYLAESPFALSMPLSFPLKAAMKALPKTTFRVLERLMLEYLQARMHGYDDDAHQQLICDFFEGTL